MAFQVPPSEVEQWSQEDVEEIWLWLQDHPLTDHWWIGAQVACLIYNANRGKGKVMRPEDFLPQTHPDFKRRRKLTPARARRALGG